MAQIRLPFPGEDDHTDRLLRTAEFLISRGRLSAACDVLELLDPVLLDPSELEEYIALADEIVARARARRREAQPVAPLPRGRVLAFRPAAPIAPPRSSSSSG